MKPVWGAPVEMRLSEMRSTGGKHPIKYAFYQDVVKRLEQTSSDRAVAYPFPDKETAEAYRRYVIHRWAVDVGPFTLMTTIRENGNGYYVMFAHRNGKSKTIGK